MKNFYKAIRVIATLFTILTAIFFIYDRWLARKNIVIEVFQIDATNLTNIPVIDGLSAHFCYKDSLVNNLWSLKYIITNTGTKTIIGAGTQSHIINREGLKLKSSDSALVIDFYLVSSNFPIEFNKNKMFFKQWRPGNYVEITAYIESLNETEPFLYIDEQDIINLEVLNKIGVSPKEKSPKVIAEYLPRWLFNTFKWLIMISISIVVITSLFAIVRQVKENPDLDSYLVKILFLIVVVIILIVVMSPILFIFKT